MNGIRKAIFGMEPIDVNRRMIVGTVGSFPLWWYERLRDCQQPEEVVLTSPFLAMATGFVLGKWHLTLPVLGYVAGTWKAFETIRKKK